MRDKKSFWPGTPLVRWQSSVLKVAFLSKLSVEDLGQIGAKDWYWCTDLAFDYSRKALVVYNLVENLLLPGLSGTSIRLDSCSSRARIQLLVFERKPSRPDVCSGKKKTHKHNSFDSGEGAVSRPGGQGSKSQRSIYCPRNSKNIRRFAWVPDREDRWLGGPDRV